jgi:hypothetical protein
MKVLQQVWAHKLIRVDCKKQGQELRLWPLELPQELIRRLEQGSHMTQELVLQCVLELQQEQVRKRKELEQLWILQWDHMKEKVDHKRQELQ